jgi:signal transduction histidine kinase
VHLEWKVSVADAATADGSEARRYGGRLRVRDDGRGFQIDAEHPGHFGLTNMKERATLLGGELHVHSVPGEGTSIEVAVGWDG